MNPTLQHIIHSLAGVYGEDEAREMAFWIAEEYGYSRANMMLKSEALQIDGLENVLLRLCRQEPLQYVFGHTLWKGLDLKVTTDTLIPRPETAELVDWVLQEIGQERHTVLDIGTGSGCIALALQQNRPQWDVTGLDISEQALAVAKENGCRNHVSVRWQQKDILHGAIDEMYDLVVSNPPYITESEKTLMKSNVLDYEPAKALFVKDDNPLLFYRAIAEQKKGAKIYFEVNAKYAHAVKEMLQALGYTSVTIKKDMYGQERMVSGRIKE